MIELLVLDVDGCMTNGQITYDAKGNELKSFNVKDGLAIASWIKLGKKVAIITGRKSDIVTQRAKELNITHIYQDIKNKAVVLDQILKIENITYENIASIGDDLNDYNMLKNSAISFTPKDGSHFLDSIITTRLNYNGGYGAIREMIELLIESEDLTEEFLTLWQ